MKKLLVIVLVALAGPALAQSSDSFLLEEQVLNAGGHPAGGQIMTSTGFRLTFDAVGETFVGAGMQSASFRLDASFGAAYPPPGEVTSLRFTDDQTLVWHPERAAGSYNLYRDLLGALPGLGYGQCEEHGLADATATDPDSPAASHGYFYLVTVENRLDEEGTKGWSSAPDERPNPDACP